MHTHASTDTEHYSDVIMSAMASQITRFTIVYLIPHPVASEHRWLVKAPRWIQCPGCLGQAVVTLRLPSAIVESLWRHKRVPFVNIASVRSRSIKRRQWKHNMDYYGVVFAHLATGRGINAKDPSGLDSDRWIPHSRCCENPARAKALAGFSRHLSAGFTDLNPAPRGLSLYNRLLKAQMKENTKAPRHRPLCGEFTDDRWIPHTKGQ